MIDQSVLRQKLRPNLFTEASAEAGSANICRIRLQQMLRQRTEASANNLSFCEQPKQRQTNRQILKVLPYLKYIFCKQFQENHQTSAKITEASAKYQSFGFNRSFGRSFGFGIFHCTEASDSAEAEKSRFGRSLAPGLRSNLIAPVTFDILQIAAKPE